MTKVVLIPTNGSIEGREIGGQLEFWMGLVGGHLEFVRVTDKVGMYINEEAKLPHLNLPRNDRATRMVNLYPGDYICGPAVLFGMGSDGEEIDCPFSVEQVETWTAQHTFGVGKAY
jgi:Domain of unknown function (DUF3846)